MIDVQKVHEWHRLCIEAKGGEPTHRVNADDCIAGAIGAAETLLFYGEYDESDCLAVAAIMCTKLARAHCYVDGNKRTAWFAFVRILASYQLSVGASDSEIVEKVNDIARGNIDHNQLIEWARPWLEFWEA